jgi:ATP-dependent helicase/nuclease subunit B
MINIVCGRQGTGKTEFIMDGIKRLPNDARIFLIVPEQFTYENERMLFDRLHTNGLMHVQVMSLQRLAYRIGENSPLQQKTILTQEGKGLILKKAVNEVLPSLRMYRSVGGTVGFLDQMSELIDEMKKNAVSVDAVSLAASADQPAALKEKLADVALIYGAYERILAGDYIDQQDYFIASAEYAGAFEPFRGAVVFFDGFYSFDTAAYLLLEAVMRCAADCTFTLTYGEEDFFCVTGDTLRRLRDTANRIGCEPEITVLREKKNAPPALCFLEENLLGYEDVAYLNDDARDAVTLSEAATAAEEAEQTACAIARAVREEGCRYSEIAVIVSDMDVYAPLIEDVFEAHEIPYFLDERRQIIFSSPVRAFLFLIAMIDHNVSGADMIAFAKTGFAELNDEDVMLLENYGMECGIKGRMWEKPFTRNNPEKSYDLTAINALREKLTAPIHHLRETMQGCGDARDFCTRIYTFLQDWKFRDKIETYVTRFAEEGDFTLSNTYAQIYNKILSVLEQAYDFFEGETIEPKEFHRMLTYAFITSTVGIIPSTADKVNIGDLARTRAAEVKLLFVLGANEGMFPSDPSDAGILTEDEKLSIKDKGVELIPLSGYRRKKETFLIYTLLAKPKNRLILSRFLQDSDGETANPSYLFERMRLLFPSLAQDDALASPFVCDRQSALTNLTKNLSDRGHQAEHDVSCDGIYDDVYRYFKTNEPWETDAIEAGLSYANEAAIHDFETYRKAVHFPLHVSISRLERYAECPFRFFAEYLLKPQKRRELSVRRADIGEVLHKIIERYSRMILDGTVNLSETDEQQTAETVRMITEDTLNTHAAGLFRQISQSPYLKTKLIRAAQSAAAEITRQLQNSDFLLTETEAKFAGQEKYRPICIDIEGQGTLWIQGIIDRIDTYETPNGRYARVIDYKTGNTEFDLTKAYYGLSLQLPMYMRVLTEQSDAMRAAGVFYFRIQSPIVTLAKNFTCAALR